MSVSYESRRTFRLWHATVGHQQVLLRSTRTDDEPTRVDVLFKGVQALKLSARLQGIVLRDASDGESNAIIDELGEPLQDGARVFVVDSPPYRGYVVAEDFFVAQDELSYNEPSSLFVEGL